MSSVVKPMDSGASMTAAFFIFYMMSCLVIIVSANSAESAIKYLSKSLFGREVFIPRLVFYLGGLVGLLSGYVLIGEELLGLPKLPRPALFKGTEKDPEKNAAVPPEQPVSTPIHVPDQPIPRPALPAGGDQLPTLERFESYIKERSNRDTIRINVAQNGNAELVYLCDGHRNGEWISAIPKLANERSSSVKVSIKGLCPYNNSDVPSSDKGRGVFIGFDRGPIPEYNQPIGPATSFAPLRYASLSVIGRGGGISSLEISFGTLSQQAIQELAQCLGVSFPRMLHKAPTGERHCP